MNKIKIIQAILEKLREDFESRLSASRRTREGGNDAESKAENKYDTLAIEQNYLADGLAKQAHAAVQAAAVYEKLNLLNFTADDPIDLGALVEMDFGDKQEWFFLGPAAGGIEVSSEGCTITVLTPESPLGGQLLDRRKGERLEAGRGVIRDVQ